MSKFKKGDYVILREDARYPIDNFLWSTLDKSLVCGNLFKVELLGRYTWRGKDTQDCITVISTAGYIPESCFDHADIPHFEKGAIVECYRLPNENDWTITKCGKIEHSLIVGAQYNVIDVIDNNNIKLNYVSGWFPPTIFRKITPLVQELPEKWCVACKHTDTDTPELLEWRNYNWQGEGYITNNKIWANFRKETIITYDTFLEKVYKPWKSHQLKVEKSPLTSINENLNDDLNHYLNINSNLENSSSCKTVTPSDHDTNNSIPHLIINKPEKKLLFTEVQELNVNLKLLKTQ